MRAGIGRVVFDGEEVFVLNDNDKMVRAALRQAGHDVPEDEGELWLVMAAGRPVAASGSRSGADKVLSALRAISLQAPTHVVPKHRPS